MPLRSFIGRAGVLVLLTGLLAGTLIAQDGMRSVGVRTAELVAADGGFAPGTTFRVGMPGEHFPEQLRAGLIEEFLRRGMIVFEEDEGREAEIRLDVVSRGPVDGDVTVSVIGMAQDDRRYVLSRAYVLPLDEASDVEGLLAPVVVISAAVLAVYLLLTVRSS